MYWKVQFLAVSVYGEYIPTYNVHSISMNNWICYGHLDYYVLIEFELYHCEVNFYPRKVRLDNRLILGLWNLIHSILKICKIESQIHESSNLMKQSFLFGCSKPYIIFLSICEIVISWNYLHILSKSEKCVSVPYFEPCGALKLHNPTDITWYLFSTHLFISDELAEPSWKPFSSARLVTFSLQLETFISARKSENGHYLTLRFFILFPMLF